MPVWLCHHRPYFLWFLISLTLLFTIRYQLVAIWSRLRIGQIWQQAKNSLAWSRDCCITALHRLHGFVYNRDLNQGHAQNDVYYFASARDGLSTQNARMVGGLWQRNYGSGPAYELFAGELTRRPLRDQLQAAESSGYSSQPMDSGQFMATPNPPSPVLLRREYRRAPDNPRYSPMDH